MEAPSKLYCQEHERLRARLSTATPAAVQWFCASLWERLWQKYAGALRENFVEREVQTLARFSWRLLAALREGETLDEQSATQMLQELYTLGPGLEQEHELSEPSLEVIGALEDLLEFFNPARCARLGPPGESGWALAAALSEHLLILHAGDRNEEVLTQGQLWDAAQGAIHTPGSDIAQEMDA